MITQEQFESLYCDNITKKQYDNIIQQIDKRFVEICNVFCVKMKGYEDQAWFDYDNCTYEGDNSGGHFDEEEYREYIRIGGEWIDPPEGYDAEFPTRWLWEQNFEKELKETIKKHQQKNRAKKKKIKERKEAKKQRYQILHASIRKKLTPEELQVIEFKS